MPTLPTREEQYTEFIDGKPIDVEVWRIGEAVETKVNIRGKIWTFEGRETAASAYDKVKKLTARIDNILQQNNIKRG